MKCYSFWFGNLCDLKIWLAILKFEVSQLSDIYWRVSSSLCFYFYTVI